jgi:hypothetical protein
MTKQEYAEECFTRLTSDLSISIPTAVRESPEGSAVIEYFRERIVRWSADEWERRVDDMMDQTALAVLQAAAYHEVQGGKNPRKETRRRDDPPR